MFAHGFPSATNDAANDDHPFSGRRHHAAPAETASWTRRVHNSRRLSDTGFACPNEKFDGIGDTALLRIREQARLQLQGRNEGRLIYELQCPSSLKKVLPLCRLRQPADIFLISKGTLMRSIEGLGVSYSGSSPYPRSRTEEPVYESLWSFDSSSEKKAFEKFIADVMKRWNQYPDMHIYHYAPYEPTAIKRLAGQHGTCVDEVDQLLRAAVFVDLYRVVRQGLRASVESYSIKKLEPLYGFTRSTPLQQALLALQSFEAVLAFGKGQEAAPATYQCY